MKIFITVISLVVIVLCAAILYRSSVVDRLLPLDDTARQLAPGKFAELPNGQVHYQWFGPEDGEITVLVHGFSTSSFVWAGLIEPLTAAGLRVLTYDHYGRGWSDRPKAVYSEVFFDNQLSDLLKHLDIRQPVNIVGYSMGGGVGTYFTANHSGQVKKLALIAPAGFPVEIGVLAEVIKFPVAGDWLMDVLGSGTMIAEMSKAENQGVAIPDLLERYKIQMSYKGYLPALLSTLRHFPMNNMSASYRSVGDMGIPVLALWGSEDRIVPAENAERLSLLVPQASVRIIEGGTHAITYSRPEEVSSALTDFLRRGE